MADAPAVATLPQSFCIEKTFNGRNGYAFIKSEDGGLDPNGASVRILNEKNHMNQFYTIINNRTYILEHLTTWRESIVKRGNGAVFHTMRWRNTGTGLRYEGVDYPVLKCANAAAILPTIHNWSFIPITEPPAPAQTNRIPNQVIQLKNYPITTIPQHAVRAILRDAVLNDEVCPITSNSIEVDTGAVTSCFHVFEKDSITKWLRMPTSEDKCPICNAKCNAYSIV
jgi:hypothetical protein